MQYLGIDWVDVAIARAEEIDSSENSVATWGQGVDSNPSATDPNACPAADASNCQAGTQSSSPGGFVVPEFVAADNDPSSASYATCMSVIPATTWSRSSTRARTDLQLRDQSPGAGQLSGATGVKGLGPRPTFLI